MSAYDTPFDRRVRYLPQAIENAEMKLAALYREAKRHRRSDILKKPSAVNAAWDREVMIAQIEAAERGQDTSMGVDSV